MKKPEVMDIIVSDDHKIVYGYDLSNAPLFAIIDGYNFSGKVWKIYLSDKKIKKWLKSQK